VEEIYFGTYAKVCSTLTTARAHAATSAIEATFQEWNWQAAVQAGAKRQTHQW
jgi:hypothetical protein